MRNDSVVYEVQDKIALIKINRPEKLNALDEDVVQGLRQAWRRFNDSDERCALVLAEGDRAFSVGADIKNPPQELWQGMPGLGEPVEKPVIAVVQGYCIGGAGSCGKYID